VQVACASMFTANALLVLAIDQKLGHDPVLRWVATIGFGSALGMMSGAWEVCYAILLADVFGLEILGTINGTLRLVPQGWPDSRDLAQNFD
jgi:hypothetical protein